MDPNKLLETMLCAAQQVLNGDADEDTAEKLAEAVESLNDWIRRGGFLPDAWKK